MFTKDLFESAQSQGLEILGAVDFDLAKELYQEELKRYEAWIQSGYQGSMSYLERGLDKRANPKLLFPNLQSVFVIAVPYNRKATGELDPLKGVRYARYLQGEDYHVKLKRILHSILDPLKLKYPELDYKICVDTSAVMERSWAKLCGIGWIGKNTLLIHPKEGSYLFIGVAYLNLKTGLTPKLAPNLCGHCEACLKSCPTEAFVTQGSLDSEKCISYLTLEYKDDWSLKPKTLEASRKKSNWVAGCDICQEVCPFNLKPSRTQDTWYESERDSQIVDATQLSQWGNLKLETELEYQNRIRNSSLSRIKWKMWQRNISSEVFK